LRESLLGHPGGPLTYRNNTGDQDLNFENEYDDEDDEGLGGPGYLNDMDFLTWDLIIKNTPKLPQLELLLHKNPNKNKKSYLHNLMSTSITLNSWWSFQRRSSERNNNLKI
jgi:hypothetical protein